MFTADLAALVAEMRLARTALLGVGNPWRGDDAAGLLLAECLAVRLRRSDLLCLPVGENPENHLGEVRDFGPELVVLCDAARFAGEAGQVRLVESGCPESTRISTHTYGLPIFLRYLERTMSCRTRLLGIGGLDYAARDVMYALSPPVKAGVQAFVDWLAERISPEPQAGKRIRRRMGAAREVRTVHEHHLARDIITTVERLARANGWRKVNQVIVRVRRPSGIMEDSLRHDFDLLKKDSPLAGAKLVVEDEPMRLSCKGCGAMLVSRNMPDCCPECGSPSLRLARTGEISLGPIDYESWDRGDG